MKQKMNNLNPADFKKFFTSDSFITSLHASLLLKGPLSKSDMLIVCKDKTCNTFIKESKEIICLEYGKRLYSDDKRYKRYFKGFKEYVEKANKVFIPKYSKDLLRMTKKEFLDVSKFLGKLWDFYGLVEFPYLDLAYRYAEGKNDIETKKRLEEISLFKFEARKVLNAYFFRGGVYQKVLAFISKKFLKKENDARYLYLDELIGLFDGVRPTDKLIKERRKCWATAAINGKIIKFDFKNSLKIGRKFNFIEKAKTLKGTPTSPGKVTGRAIIMPMLNDHDSINVINKRMKKGDILVAETTSPDIMMLCRKAAAIVSDQGGLLSHAAVVSRELNIPCIIGTRVATRVIKNGDLVEVNADKGSVNILKGK